MKFRIVKDYSLGFPRYSCQYLGKTTFLRKPKWYPLEYSKEVITSSVWSGLKDAEEQIMSIKKSQEMRKKPQEVVKEL